MKNPLVHKGSNHAVYLKLDQNKMKNKKVADVCIVENWKLSSAAIFVPNSVDQNLLRKQSQACSGFKLFANVISKQQKCS